MYCIHIFYINITWTLHTREMIVTPDRIYFQMLVVRETYLMVMNMDVNQIAFSPNMSKWDHLPEELQQEIFLKLDFESLNISQLVCKSWNDKISPILKKLEQKLETLLINTEPRTSTSSSS